MSNLLLSHAFRVFTRLFVMVGIVVALSLMFSTGDGGGSIILMSLFTAWVLSPFMALLAASMTSENWPRKRQLTLNLIMLLLPPITVLAFTGLINPPGTRPAFMFLVVPAVSWLLLLAIGFAGRTRNPTKP